MSHSKKNYLKALIKLYYKYLTRSKEICTFRFDIILDTNQINENSRLSEKRKNLSRSKLSKRKESSTREIIKERIFSANALIQKNYAKALEIRIQKLKLL